MRNYVIINGVNSLTIQGLAIKTLPPITKPIQRNLREEIDGRDGDIVTTLGYGAYDKTIEIGLFGTFDIDEVIAYFNQKGTITFSNELDKVYNFQALEQVDYAELLKFRTANVVLHCQPFKYPTEEEPLEVEYEYVEATGTDITLNDTAGEKFNKIIPKGNTSQTGTPTPTSPQPVNVVSGDNVLSICGKNLIPFTNQDFTVNNVRYYVQDGSLYFNGTSTGETSSVNTNFKNYFSFTLPAGTYTISHKTGVMACYLYKYEDNTLIKTLGTDATSQTFTLTEQTKVFIGFYVYQKTFSNINSEIMISTTATTYEPYIGQDYPIYLGVKNLANYQDIPNAPEWTSYPNAKYIELTLKPNTNYTMSSNVPLGSSTLIYFNGTSTDTNGIYLNHSRTQTSDSNGKLFFALFTNRDYYNDIIDGTYYIQIEEGSKANSYTPYGTTPIELCKIGTYQDYIYKDNGVWYLHKEIGKVVLDGSENWTNYTNLGNNSRCYYIKPNAFSLNSQLFSNYFIKSNLYETDETGIIINPYGTSLISIKIPNSDLETQDLAGYKTWLSTHNTIVYYVLATPTDTEITDTTLLEQLESLSMANSVQGQTNISQENNDMPFIIDVDFFADNTKGNIAILNDKINNLVVADEEEY